MWERDTTIGCLDVDEGSITITDGSTSYQLWDLEEDSQYIMSVTASNSAGSNETSNTVTAMTMEAGEKVIHFIISYTILKCL